ncbi:trimeric intracellular cation channel family protein [Pseudonocardiaceae bacterium YIM PH 21723]|nr:trimeric intracellular cation channel family protein [Pseudonocardiaceae bacterium YIM PH 21723]
MLLFLELLGTAVFAASGALAAVRSRLDILGVVILGMTTALGGGIVRDVLLGVHPPTTLTQGRWLAVSGAAGLIVFFFHNQLARLTKLRSGVLVADAIGLGLFSTTSTTIALAYGAPVYSACLIGMTAGVGGGAMRDVLLRQVPLVLQKEIYALAALAGAMVVAVGHWLHLPQDLVIPIGAVLATGLRIVAMWRGWHAPIARNL